MSGQIEIVPKVVNYTKDWGSFSILCTELELGTKAVFATTFYGPQGGIVDCFKDVIEGEEYAAWGSNDQYIINLIATRHGCVVASN